MSGILQTLFLGAVATVKDAYFNLVTLLLNTTSTNGAQNNTFLDSSSNNFTITRNGNTTQGTFTPFSQTGWSIYNPDALGGFGFPASTNLDMGTGDFTIEAWVNTAKLPTTNAFQTTSGGYQSIFGTGPSSSSTGSQLYIGTTNLFFDISVDGGGPINVAHNMVAGQWYHVAITRSGTTFRAFINGVLVQTGTSSTSWQGGYGWGIMRPEPVGSYDGAWWYGYISNFRAVKGSALYTTAFTPSTTPLSAVAGTALLTAQDNRFRDASSNNFTASIAGTPSVQAFSPFAPTTAYSTSAVGGSGYFDGTGDSLAFPTSQASLLPGSGAFTYEVWFYQTVATSNSPLVSYGTGTGNLRFFVANSTSVTLWNGASNLVNQTVTNNLNSWNHIVVQRDGSNVVSIYYNGARIYNNTVSSNFNAGTLSLGVDGAVFWSGYLSGFKATIGSAVYSGTSITVPTAPPSPTGATACVLFTNAGIYDAAAKNDLETVGNAQVSTTQAKFGTTSIAFDGAGDYLRLANGSLVQFNAGDFTIEGFLYLNNLTGNQTIIDCRPGTASSNYILFYYTANSLNVYINGSTVITGGALTATTWNHIALTRSGTSMRLFVNGTQVGSTATNSTNFANPGNGYPFIGSNYVPGDYLNGYLDEFRITNGYARYTANFTPPAAAFPVQ